MRKTLSTLFLLAVGLHATAQSALTNEKIWSSRTFRTEYVGGLASMNDGNSYTVLEEEGIVQYGYKDGKRKGVLVSGKDLMLPGGGERLSIEGYSFSSDEQKVLIETNVERLYRYSYFAHHYIYDRATKKVVPLSDPGKSKQRLATFSPDGKRAAFVRDNDIFVVDLSTMTEEQVTRDGEWNKVLNGATDWVYEEEFALVQGYAWSPKSTKILYLRSDEGQVKEFDMTYYRNKLYPEEYRFKYPKAGEDNSRVELQVYDCVLRTTTMVPQGDKLDAPYFPRFGWTNDDETLWFMRMNRLQNEKLIYTVHMPMMRAVNRGLQAKEVYKETSDTYVEVTDDLYFLSDGSAFILTSEKSGWNHIYWCSMNGDGPRPVTGGDYDVIEVQGIDEARQRIIFTAAMKSPSQQEVWAVKYKGKGLQQLSPEGGVNEAEWSTGFNFFINTRSTANSVPVITLHQADGRQVKVLKDNAPLTAKLKEHGVRDKEFFTFTTAAGHSLNGWMIKPPSFDSRKRYPVLITQYSGPNSNEVTDAWGGANDLWHQMMAQKGYLIVCVDPRGTGHRGREFRHVTYGQLGKYETEDMMATAEWLAQQPYVAGDRIGIWGWSYGGYMSSLCITKGADLFKCAIAVAPVTNWRYYDTIYTERYMGLPQDNAKGYDDNSPINHVEKLKGPYLLVHGITDDNVHYQNSAEMVNALVAARKQFTHFAYPDRNHGIYGGSTRLHLFEMMTEFLEENL